MQLDLVACDCTHTFIVISIFLMLKFESQLKAAVATETEIFVSIL